MKRNISLFFAAALLCAVTVANVRGQVQVTGHITAEVIASVHAISTVITGFALKNTEVKNDNHPADETWKSETLNLGALSINAGEKMACNIQLKEATLSDSKGNSFTIAPTTLTSGNQDTLRADGSQTLSLNGTALLTHGLEAGSYEGSYSLLVLYN